MKNITVEMKSKRLREDWEDKTESVGLCLGLVWGPGTGAYKQSIRNRTSNTEIGRAKTGWGAAETGFASPISVLQVLF